ncbi:flavin monoamine oxidase family protein [Filimonas effusa]|uniref:Tryptophan 2-monooxygenase n=1 Tax=Filimonas effusa TaxID=2508721 RepID=A0A4Q1D9W1_9BACT|nr:NAD(P)/FAD-dependent oxidoreductase [Filimonas effusa]RXK86010.1 FAD-dependent oxidoreductase [Filimonas effusa]
MKEKTNRDKLIIVGGGAAGLLAAKELCNDHAVTVLEARPAIGGRMLAGGAEFVHGRLPLTLDLLKVAGISYTAVAGRFFHVSDGKWQPDADMIEGWDGLLAQMASLKTDTTMTSFLDIHYPGAGYAGFRDEVKSFVAGYDLADPNTVSVQALYREWSHEDEVNFRIAGGYNALIDYLARCCYDADCEIVTGKTVYEVVWGPGEVKVVTTDGSIYEATKLIVTIPLWLLQKGAIHFSPRLPQYEAAAQQIGWGTVIKVILTFKTAFWQKQQEDIGFIFSDEVIPTWWTQAPDEQPVLSGWLGGPSAKEYAGYTDEMLLQTALACLARIFDLEISDLEEHLDNGAIFNWQNDVFTKGAYSYDLPGSAAARQLLNKPVADTLYFAGEALYDGNSPGTVEAALTTGKNVAARIGGSV